MAETLKNFKDLGKVVPVVQPTKMEVQLPKTEHKLIRRIRFGNNLGLKPEYDLEERKMPIRFQPSFFIDEPKSVAQLGSRFPDGIDIEKVKGKAPISICQVLCNFAEMSEDKIFYKTDYVSLTAKQSKILAMLEMFNLPNDAIDFCHWLIENLNQQKIKIAKASMERFEKKHWTQQNMYYFLPYEELYSVYKTNKAI